MKRRLLLLMTGLVLGQLVSFAQTTVTGTVVAEDDGEPIVGATVKVTGTDKATITDIDGKFSISAPTDAKLEFTYVGMLPQTSKARRDMIVTMRTDQQTLDDVLVVAYGTQKKSAFTGSATVVNSTDISKHTSIDPMTALVGKVPGVVARGGSGRPGSSNVGSVRIRGIGNVSNGVGPLVIVDGVEGASYTSPEDIESITVLKDAASAALYGSRAAGGVILITTKKGGSGRANVTFDMKLGSNSRNFPEYNTIKDPAQYYEAYYSQLYNRYLNVEGLSSADANVRANERMLSDLAYNLYNVPTGQQLIGTDGKINPNATLGRTYTSDGTTYYLGPDDWEKAAYRNSFRQEYNLTVSGGNTKNNYYLSGNYLNDNGVVEYSRYEKLAVRGNFNSEVKKWLRVGGQFGISHSRVMTTPGYNNWNTSGGNLEYITSMMAPIYPIYVRVLDENGNPTIQKDANGNDVYDFGIQGLSYPGLATRTFGPNNNPLAENRYNNNKNYSTGWHVIVTADVDFTSWLKLGLKNSFYGGNGYSSDYSNMLYASRASGGVLSQGQSNYINYNLIQQLDFHKVFGKHDVSATLAHDYYNTRNHSMSGQKHGGYSTTTLEFNYFAVPDLLQGSSSRAIREGYLVRGLYSYDDRYFANASYRRDGSTGYAKDQRWGNFWSVGAAWQINKEQWYHVDWLNYLKLKASIGQVGNNIGMGGLTYLQLYSLRAAGTTMTPVTATMANPSYTWETTTTWNVGVEFGVFNNLITGSLDVYRKKVKNMGFWLSLPESTGYAGYSANAGDMRNSGVELELNANPIRTKDINWTIGFNLAHNSTKILKLPAQKTRDYGGYVDNSSRGFQTWYAEGESMYNAFLPSYAGVDQTTGEALYYYDPDVPESDRHSYPSKNKTETTTDWSKASYYVHGSTLPKVTGGFSTTLEIYGFDISAYFDYQLGGKTYDFRYASLMSPSKQASGVTFSTDIFKSWTPQNTSSNIPRFYYGDNYTTSLSDRFLTSARYLNFASFTVGYTLPTQLIMRTKYISKLRVYVTGENLCFWSARKGLDPRFSYTENAAMGDYSPVRTISGGIQITF